MKLSNILYLLVVIVFAASCSSEQSSKEMHEEVIKYHDKAMAEMGTLRTGFNTLSGQLNSMGEDVSEESKEELQEKLQKVEAARKNMMVWMQQFHQRYDEDLSEEEKVRILKDELEKVKKVDDDIAEAVAIINSL